MFVISKEFSKILLLGTDILILDLHPLVIISFWYCILVLKSPSFWTYWHSRSYPGRGGQTKVTPDQTSFERTHVPVALELHGLEKASSALLSGQWSRTCLIRGHFVLGRSDQRQFQAHTSLIRGRFERTLVWPETNSIEIFSCFFVFLLPFVVWGKSQQ